MPRVVYLVQGRRAGQTATCQINVRTKASAHRALQAAAHQLVREAQQLGLLPPVRTLKCIRCGVQSQVYHHPDGYEGSNAVNVVPMCLDCHGITHHADPARVLPTPTPRRQPDWEGQRQRRLAKLRELTPVLRALREEYRKSGLEGKASE